MASAKVEDVLANFYSKIGLTNTAINFNQDGTYTMTIKGRTTSSGTYVFNPDKKSITMKTKLGLTLNAHVSVDITGQGMSLQFKSDKLMSALKALTGLASKISSNASTITSLATNYDGLLLGFKLSRA